MWTCSAALCRGLIEASIRRDVAWRRTWRSVPRLYAAASLKRVEDGIGWGMRRMCSAALCRGLIEAPDNASSIASPSGGVPRLYAAASLKRDAALDQRVLKGLVFRGFMPRPH